MRKKAAFLLPILILVTNLIPNNLILKSKAEACMDLIIVFARGSGAERESDDYLEFKNQIETKLQTTNLKYEFIDLDYPAISVGLDHLDNMLGAFISGGKSYGFGESVGAGVDSLSSIINGSCEQTKFVLGGYSQGAMVVLQSLSRINPDKIIYAATFGDPKLYLPEGGGIFPAACMNINLSNYRIYVPDCYAHNGLLGGENPYQLPTYQDKLGTWCNKRDIMCSSHLSISDHIGYIKSNIYEDASRLIFDKITKTFGIRNEVSSPHDTVILIDSTGSMREIIDQYKREAVRLAKLTFEKDGRVALYEYRDLKDPFEPVIHCDFNTCTLNKIESALNSIETDGGGDDLESLLSVSIKAMREMEWRYGATKSVIVLTDAGFHIPDFDGTTTEDVISLSRKIDPVNFYVVTTPKTAPEYEYLTSATGGRIAIISTEEGRGSDLDDILNPNSLTNYVLARYDSLPRVEEAESTELPELAIMDHHKTDSGYQISFTSNTEQTLIIINDTIVGFTTEKSILITDLNYSQTNNISLIPILDNRRGKAATLTIEPTSSIDTEILVPNTGVK